MPRTLVSLGSNLGDAAASLDAAIEGLEKLAVTGTLRASSRHATPPIGGPAGQSDFLNAAATFDSELPPLELLAALQAIEQSLDRTRHTRWAARTLDVDLLLYGDGVIDAPTLRVPHPRMSFRPFVLEPAEEVAGDWWHPECGATIAQLLEQLQSGADALLLVGDDGGDDNDVREWIAAERGITIRVVEEATALTAPRLTIDANRTRTPAPVPGPRLALVDCPAGHWREEVLAAVECVWPRANRSQPPVQLGPGQ
ncbi:2-amino-4-hydroxy-6-hydroxymethyldihydropteridine diphosphokinase [Botrimarina mediterranea]|uniref:2-amino-4-hydroxy-6-hydroxymethyldihydropteridine pyrophosphokinase n=1 Tax=Botrimarina mediterranea TaxID=2528022 RepID=A0A518KEJ7_9BACT|nr:2-amino-4-hydroxy-6-hydroxymethyldihydropteridine diphosphokinase [Botrimarina mediterranea]QDV76197.1 2-amino-4-hydroxy-6-hydroxymethyldihydropteridine pyrophosphokinase [Botrimarina mediterranea]